MEQVRKYVQCPVCGEELQEDVTLFLNKSGDVIACDSCVLVCNADRMFDFWEDADEELYRIADDENDIARWEREMNKA